MLRELRKIGRPQIDEFYKVICIISTYDLDGNTSGKSRFSNCAVKLLPTYRNFLTGKPKLAGQTRLHQSTEDLLSRFCKSAWTFSYSRMSLERST